MALLRPKIPALQIQTGQSLVLLMREEGVGGALGGAGLGLVCVERGELLASTACYRARLASLGGAGDGGGTGTGAVRKGRQLLRFLNNARRFSPAEVRLFFTCP